MQRFIRDNYVNVLDPSADARLVIESGEEVIAETWDAFMGTWAAGSEREILGPVAGPIAVKGAEPGDALKVEILDIRPVEAVYGILCKRVFCLMRQHAIFELNRESVQSSFPVMNGHGPFPANVV